jgi:membrane associated rhomboid family serine protease
VFPLRDENPTLKTAVVTVIVIVANVVVWLYVQGAGYSARVMAESVCQLGLIPAEVTGLAGSVRPDASLPCVLGGLTYSAAFSSMFLHGGWLHLLGNMWFLWLFGNNVEDVMGHGRFIVFYLLVGLAATVAHVLSAPGSVLPTIGASGAISGIMGAYLVLYPRVRIQTVFVFIIFLRVIPVPAWLVLIMWFALQVMTGYATPADTGGVAVWAHVGGFVAGVVMVRVFVNSGLMAARRERALLNTNSGSTGISE